MSWADGRMAALDCEATCTDPCEARIVSVAFALVGGGLDPDTFSAVVNPGVEVPAEAAEVHGFTTERVRAEGLDPKVVIPALLAILETVRAAAFPLVAFVARYDLTVLDREARRHGFGGISLERLCVVDPFVIDRHLDRFRRGSRRLEAQCEHYGVTLDAAHDAESDAIAAARLAWRLAKAGKVIRRRRTRTELAEYIALCSEWKRVRDDLPALFEAQRVWARAERERFAEYQRSIGEHAVAAQVMAEDWPMVPYREEREAA